MFGYSINLQSCFPSIAVLKSVRSLNLKPPSSLGQHSLSHDFQCVPLVLPPELHQDCVNVLISFFITVFGIRKHDITLFGKALLHYCFRTSAIFFVFISHACENGVRGDETSSLYLSEKGKEASFNKTCILKYTPPAGG